MRRNVFSFLLILLTIFALAACGASDEGTEDKKEAGNNATDENVRVIEHEMGTTEIEGTPEKIVALEFSYVDALAALGISPVGIADDNDENRIIAPIKEKIDDYTSVGTRKQPSLEVISSLQPDLIIADLQRHKDIYDELSEIAPTIVLSSLAADYDEIIEGFKTVSVAVGQEEKGEQVLEEHQNRMAELKAQVPEDETRTVMPGVVTADGFHAHNFESYTGSLLESIGLKNAIQSGDARYNKINLEQVVEFNPDIIFTMVAGETTVIDEWEGKELWNQVSAVQNNAIYEVDRNMWSRFRGLISSEKILEEAINNLYK